MSILRRLATGLPHRWQTELKRIHFGRQIKKNTFITQEPEYKILESLIRPGDWVLDIGANVGHYTKRFSELVGRNGRVIAFEPVPTTFSLLSANAELFANRNVSLINAAVSDHFDVVGMSIPTFSSGSRNYYQAHLSSTEDSTFSVLTISIDSLCISNKVSLIKIDAEGHEEFVLAGMKDLIVASHPILIVETGSEKLIKDLAEQGYEPQRLPGSPNILFKPIA